MNVKRIVGWLETLGAIVGFALGLVHQVDPTALSTWPALLSFLGGFFMHALNHPPGAVVNGNLG